MKTAGTGASADANRDKRISGKVWSKHATLQILRPIKNAR